MNDARTAPPPARLLNIPNGLSLARLVLAIASLALITAGYFQTALVVFALAAVSDGLDGYLARRLNQATAIGRQLDPLVDKLMVSSLFIFLLPLPGSGLAPWMVALIVARELIIQWLRSLMEGSGVAFGAQMAGKLKTTLQCLAICAILIGLARPELLDGPMRRARDGLIWTALLLTIYSGSAYLLGALPRLRGSRD